MLGVKLALNGVSGLSASASQLIAIIFRVLQNMVHAVQAKVPHTLQTVVLQTMVLQNAVLQNTVLHNMALQNMVLQTMALQNMVLQTMALLTMVLLTMVLHARPECYHSFACCF